MRRAVAAIALLSALSVAYAAGEHEAALPAPLPTPGATQTATTAPVPTPQALQSFSPEIAHDFVAYLAGPECAGRASGTTGCDQAGVYIAAHMEAWGLRPAGVDGFRQPFQVALLPFPAQRHSINPVGGRAWTFNVCALVEGSDPVLRDEVVVVSAHYDHVGSADAVTDYAGADDNASGTAALMLVARAFATQGASRPRRSILLLFFSAEERGLLGSRRWVSRPTVLRDNVICNLNMDMVGRNARDEMLVYGNASSPDLDAAHRRVAEDSGFRWRAMVGSVFERSDQASFYEARIPSLYFTSGLHRDYHTTADRPERVDTVKLAGVARHAFLVAWDVANQTERPRYARMGPDASVGPLGAVLDMVPRPALPSRVALPDGTGVAVIQTVIDGGAAERAGLRSGDLVIGVGPVDWLPQDDPVAALEELARRGRLEGVLELRVQRGTKVKVVRVDLR